MCWPAACNHVSYFITLSPCAWFAARCPFCLATGSPAGRPCL
jgi:hypothetical protein